MLCKHLTPLAAAAALLALAACGSSNHHSSSGSTSSSGSATPVSAQDALSTATPIKHLVVIYGENVSFDHYFGTYPNATNPSGEPAFTAAAGTPTASNLEQNNLLTANPTVSNSTNTSGTNINPFRLDRSQAFTEDQNHSYTPEQLASDNGKMDAFPFYTGNNTQSTATPFGTPGLVMGYFDGNTVTSMWNYAQHFALSDNTYTDTYGPSTPGAIEVVSGQNNGVVVTVNTVGAGGTSVSSSSVLAAGSSVSGPSSVVYDTQGGWTLISDQDPTGDVCSLLQSAKTAGSTYDTVSLTSKNIGDLLNAADITWGGFTGGFNLSITNPNGTTGCKRSSTSTQNPNGYVDYIQHHNWFQYYASTANLTHQRPTSVAYIGGTDPLDNSSTPVHHQYDVDDFFTAVSAGNFPSVSFLKAPGIADGHAGYSDPLDEQAFVTSVVNFLEQQPDWKNTAVVVTYDDSDGWYDHQYATPTTSSFDSTTKESAGGTTVTGADQLNGAGICNATGAKQGAGLNGGTVNGRCGPGTRIPLLVISPYAKQNYVDHTQLTQSSVVKFIEDNWLGGKRIGQGSNDANDGSLMNMFNFSGTPAPALYLDPTQGTKLASPPAAASQPAI